LKKITIIAETLASQVFPQLQGKELEIFTSELKVSKTFVQSQLSQICSKARAQQLLLTQLRGNTHTLPSFLSTLESTLKRFVRQTELHHFKLDKKETEVIFYEPFSSTMTIYNVKPAVFDFFLSMVIGIYLTLLYLFLVYYKPILSLTVSRTPFLGKSKLQ